MHQHYIFWADDDPDDLNIFREVLTDIDQRASMVSFTNGRELLDRLEQSTAESYPCLIVLDINMPVLDGRKTLMAIKHHSRFNEIPVVVFSTSKGSMDQIYCEKLGSELITKPASYEKLTPILIRLLAYCSH